MKLQAVAFSEIIEKNADAEVGGGAGGILPCVPIKVAKIVGLILTGDNGVCVRLQNVNSIGRKMAKMTKIWRESDLSCPPPQFFFLQKVPL